jgi:hypothetical protein
VWEGEYSANTVYTYVNGKMIPVEIFPGRWERGINVNVG